MASYIGVVNVDSKRPNVREIRGGMQYYEVVVGISEDNIYLLRRHPFRREEHGFSLVKKPKNSDSYATIRKDLTNGISFISNDEKAFVALCEALPGLGNELSPKIFAYVPIRPDTPAPTRDYLITFPKDSAFRLTSVISPDGEYVVVEERHISLWETPPRTSQRFLALDLKTRELSLLYERPHVWDARGKRLGAIKWIRKTGTYDSVYSLNVVNN
jgi:hypothetical protein